SMMPHLILSKSLPIMNNSTCPNNCVCEFAVFTQLPISRWVAQMTNNNKGTTYGYIKLATCLLQLQSEVQMIIGSLPLDLQALVLLSTSRSGRKLTINSSSLCQLKQLNSLEFRGTGAVLNIDEPLNFLQNANFEMIQMQASEKLKRPKFSKLPSDKFDYRPPSEVLSQSEYGIKYPLHFDDTTTDIVTYERHIQRLKESRIPTFFGWNQMKILRIIECQLDELHWQIFDGMTQLNYLSLEKNSIKDLPPFAFSGAIHLKYISLAHNNLGRLHYLGLAGLLELETLNLSDNQLKSLNELCFPPMPMLQSVDLRNNPIKTIFPATFWVMNATKDLQMGSIHEALSLRTWDIYGQFDSLIQLKTLALRNVSTESLGQGVFKGLYGLHILTLRGSIKSIEFDAFAELEQLRELDMSYCMIRELSMDALIGAKRLQLLNLSYNFLRSVPPGLLDDQQELEVVELQGNLLKSLPPPFFLLPNVRVIRLDQNPWQCTCEMSNWIYHLTNVVPGPVIQSCIKNIRGEPTMCKTMRNYEMDKTIIPRCINYNGRSVYYVLRRHIQCGSASFVRAACRIKTKGLAHWQKMKLHMLQLKEILHNRSQIERYSQLPNNIKFFRNHKQESTLNLDSMLSNYI
ncbi:hypothetical protein KR018_011738, partial [Drosophila ironensis]